MKYTLLTENEKENTYGGTAELGMGLVTAFGVIAIITVIVYKIFQAKKGDVALPGGFKFKFTT